MSVARKFFRLFKQFEFGSNAVKNLALPDEVLKATGALKQIGMLVYYTCEALVLVSCKATMSESIRNNGVNGCCHRQTL